MKEKVKIYYYSVKGTKYYTPNVIFAHSRAMKNDTDVYFEEYEVEALPKKK